MKITAQTEAVSSPPEENELWNTKWRRSTLCAEKKPVVDWKKDLRNLGAGRKSRKPPTPFVGYKPNGKCQIDPLGENFIAVGSHFIGGFGSPFEHMTIEYYIEACPNVTEGTRFSSPSEIGVSGPSDSYQLEPHDWIFGHWTTIQQKGTTEKLFVSDTISFIEHGSSATHRIVIYSDATSDNAAGAWKTISGAAQSYAYAEQSAVESPHGGPLQHWPNSVYQLLGNNSDTFIREMARAIGRDADVIGGVHPGNEYPQGVPYPGYTPVRMPPMPPMPPVPSS